MIAYASGNLGDVTLKLSSTDRVIAIGSDGMMAAVARARHSTLAPYLKPDHHAIGSINSPMQCMMKEICAQCLQMHKDPTTGEETVVFSCFNQDQSLDKVDWANLRTRLAQNGVQEKLTKQWIDRCLHHLGGAAKNPRRLHNQMDKRPRIGILIAVTYGLVIGTMVLAIAGYFYYRADMKPGDQADVNPMRRMMVGAVWVPIYNNATYVEPASTQEKESPPGR
ncbi:MAG: hypothetical protein WDO18_18330 [Acidobacteriota bacterium]